MPDISPLAPTDELEAVNTLLAAIGETPVNDHTTSQRADVRLAVDLLRRASVALQTRGWKFNREFGLELAPTDTISWVGADGSTDLLNVFTPPVGALRCEATPTSKQSYEDIVLRPPRVYTGATRVFYDRVRNRDGLSLTSFPALYVNVTWLFDFGYLPEEAIRFITLRAARQFIQQAVGSSELAGFSQMDESLAWRDLLWAHGEEDSYNVFNEGGVGSVLGFRPGGPRGVIDQRNYTRTV